MARVRLFTALVTGLLLAGGCGGEDGRSPTPTGPTGAPASNSSTFSLSGLVVDDGGQVVPGATVTVLDGRNANASATTDRVGQYNLTGLSAGGFTLRVRRDGHDDATRGVTLTGSTTADFTLTRASINLTGTLTGTHTYTSSTTGQTALGNTTATVTQNGSAIRGTFRIRTTGNPADDWTGSFDGTLSSLTPTAAYTGSLTISALISTGSGRCNGERSTVTGTATHTRLVLSAPGLWSWRECVSTSLNTVITLNR